MLFLPTFGGADLTNFRTTWGAWAWVSAITFTILVLARSVDLAVATTRERRNGTGAKPLRFTLLDHRCWWHLARQRDDSFISQLSFEITTANVTDRPVLIVGVSLRWPKKKGKIVHADVMLPSHENAYYSSKHPVLAHSVAPASVHIMFRGILGRQGRPLRATLVLKDHLGHEYRLKRIAVPTSDALPPRISWERRIKSLLSQMRPFAKPATTDVLSAPPEWAHGGTNERIDIVLDEERRSYAARGRVRGGLGSLNIGLQSEPNGGWTTEGEIPKLLWDQGQSKQLESRTLKALLKMHGSMASAEKTRLENYLISHLDKRSCYADIGYFLFLALHRMGRTIDALRAARSNLSGDKVFGYSNVLGALAALISHEYFQMHPDLLAEMATVLGTDADSEFRLAQKINLARLRAVELEATGLPNSPESVS
ncbi:hypothetical protein [Shumkonia mesophila]|uniref:hypothetical protein n=1 Tax=Shumkonia mesophila TaxID=2838854 RepID=UPI002934239F|nr:hypothetical protein [Shumkonia mesophila]